MYLEYFGLNEAPFSITPDPTFVYLSQRHRDALAHLLYGVGQGGSGGFVQLTGEVGTGKTTLCRCLLEQVPEGTQIALILNPMMSPVELLAAICEELAIDIDGIEHSPRALVDRLNQHLLRVHSEGGRVVLVIDEAQNLGPDALEQVRLLTNLETSKEKLLQIILLGQPELRDLLRRQSLRQLAQRITARYHLTPLGPEETARYLAHRLEVAGAPRNPFKPSACRAIYQRSQGVPRLINVIADRALVAAFAQERQQVNAAMVHAAADEVQLGEPAMVGRRWPRYAAASVAVLALAVAAWFTVERMGAGERPPAQAALPSTDVERGAVVAVESPAGESQPAGSEVAATVSAGGTGREEVASVESRPAPARQTAEPDVPQTTSDGAPEPLVEIRRELEPAWLESQDLRAWQELGAAWGRPEDAALIEASCRGREGLGYACLGDQGSLLRIRQLGLPVVLVLVPEQGAGAATLHLVLRGLADDRLLVGDRTDARVVNREAVEERWYGEFYVAWPQAVNWPREVARGDQGEAVERILELAGRAEPPYRGAAEFGPDFESWLQAFQSRNGLDADGIVGPKTLLYLMRFSIDEPRLLGRAELEAAGA